MPVAWSVPAPSYEASDKMLIDWLHGHNLSIATQTTGNSEVVKSQVCRWCLDQLKEILTSCTDTGMFPKYAGARSTNSCILIMKLALPESTCCTTKGWLLASQSACRHRQLRPQVKMKMGSFGQLLCTSMHRPILLI